MARERITAATCRTCGLCCVAPWEQDAFCDVSPSDLERLPPRYRLKVVAPSLFDQLIATIEGRALETALATKQIEIQRGPFRGAEAFVCVALRGSPGKQVSCDVYERRPRVCREAVVPGDRTCRRLRRSAKM